MPYRAGDKAGSKALARCADREVGATEWLLRAASGVNKSQALCGHPTGVGTIRLEPEMNVARARDGVAYHKGPREPGRDGRMPESKRSEA
ncbi:MAG: hypothetical protein QME92_09810 [Bacillota bacterium]|nr:hypothetical protein [Bacillota bacterium]